MSKDKDLYLKKVASVLGVTFNNLKKAIEVVDAELEAEEAKEEIKAGATTSDKFDEPTADEGVDTAQHADDEDEYTGN